MLRKSIKYEFKATGRLFLPLYAALIVMSVIACFVFANFGRSETFGQTMITMITTLLTVGVFTAVWVIAVIVIIKRFWDNLLGREGYLTNVLPVSPWQHVFTKLLAAFVWVAASAIVSAAALVIMTSFIFPFDRLGELFSEIGHAYSYAASEGLAGLAALCTVLAVLAGVFSAASVILHAYAAMSIGQLCSRHRIWACLGAYVGISVVLSILSGVLLGSCINSHVLLFGLFGPDDFSSFGGSLSFAAAALALYTVYQLITSGAMYAASSLLLKNRLNLQ